MSFSTGQPNLRNPNHPVTVLVTLHVNSWSQHCLYIRHPLIEQLRSVTITPPSPPPLPQHQHKARMRATSLLPLSQQWHVNICKTKFPGVYLEYQRSRGGQEVGGALWINEGLHRNEINVERRAGVLGTFQVQAHLAVQRPWGSRATRRPVWLEQGAEVGECTAELAL